MRYSIAAGCLLVLGLAQMTGDLLHLDALKGGAATTGAAPAPKVFSAARIPTGGLLETYSTRFALEWTAHDGSTHTLPITPEVGARLRGPYNRRNTFGAILAYGPILATDAKAKPMFDAVARYALCGDAPLLREVGIDPAQVKQGSVRIRVEPLPGTDMGTLPRTLEAPCP